MKKIHTTVAGITIALVGLHTGLNLYAVRAAEAKVGQFIEEMSDTADVTYQNIDVNLLSRAVKLEDITIVPVDSGEEFAPEMAKELAIERITIHDIDERSKIPTRLAISAEGIQLPIDATDEPGLAQILEESGIGEAIPLNIDFKYKLNPDNRELNVERFQLSADDLGELDINFKLGNVQFPTSEDSESSIAWNKLVFYQAQVDYQDHSLAKSLIAKAATESDQSPEDFTRQLESDITSTVQFFVPAEALVVQVAFEESMSFLKNPKGFSISATPERPLAIMELADFQNPQFWAENLNLEIRAH